MRRPSIARRVLQGTVFASGLSALVLAAAAALVALVVWRNQERQELEETRTAFASALAAEVAEHDGSLARGAREAVVESAIVGYRVEVWRDGALVAANLQGPSVGVAAAPGIAIDDQGWLKSTSWLADRAQLVVAVRSRRAEALRVFGVSLALAAPVCLGFAWLIGSFVGRRATRPLLRFSDRLARAEPFRPLGELDLADAPADVAELEESFGTLWERLHQALAREREFAANASHELRLPLTRIRLRAERAMAAASPEAKEELLEQAGEIDRMVRLVDSLLVLSRDPSAGIPGAEAVNVADVTRAAAARLLGERWLAAGDDLPDEALVRGDEDLLSIAVENLLDNAAKFTPGGEAVRVALAERDHRVELVVTSPGARIEGGQAERLFERFYRSPQARVSQRGHGLGLPLARHIARLHGGEVRCVSRPHEDAAFELCLPGWSPHAVQGAQSL